MINKRVRQLLAEDRPAWGLFINLAEPAVVEIAGHAGYDFAIFDMEHTSLTFQSVENLLRASGNVGMTGIVRVPDKNPKTILRAVDIGADGVMVPHVLDASEARQVVEAARYRPEGDRGISGVCRAANYGATPFLKHAEQSNHDLLVSVMIEDQSAAEDIEAIAAVDGLDVCFVGPADLTRSLGFMGQHDVPRTAAVVEPLAAKVRSVDKAKLGIPAFHYNYERDEQALVNLGFRLITCGSDLSTLLKGFRENLKRTGEVL